MREKQVRSWPISERLKSLLKKVVLVKITTKKYHLRNNLSITMLQFADRAWSDEQKEFKCNTKEPGWSK